MKYAILFCVLFCMLFTACGPEEVRLKRELQEKEALWEQEKGELNSRIFALIQDVENLEHRLNPPRPDPTSIQRQIRAAHKIWAEWDRLKNEMSSVTEEERRTKALYAPPK